MRQDLAPVLASPAAAPAVGSAFVNDADDLHHVPMPRAAWAAILVGGTGLAAVSCLYAFGNPMVAFMGGVRTDLLGPALGLLLWGSAGGYGLLMFYGARLRWLWARRRLPAPPGPERRTRSPLQLALADLRRVRWLSAAVLLIVLPVYLIPSHGVAFVGPSWGGSGWHWDGLSDQLTRLTVLAWIGLSAVPVLATRRAAWEIAAARGDLAGPADVPGFQVMMPGAASQPLPAHPAADVPVIGTPVTATAVVPPLVRPIATADDQAARPQTATPVPALSDRGPDADAVRDWETVLLVLLVATIMVAVVRLDATRGAWQSVGLNPSVWGQRYTYFAQLQYVRPPGSWPTVPNEPVAGLAGLATLAAPVVRWFAYVAIVAWATAGLMAGPRSRRAATWLAAAVVATTAVELAANLYLSVRYADASSQSAPTPAWWVATGGNVPGGTPKYPQDALAATDVAAHLYPTLAFVALLVVMTRPAVRGLFDRRVRKARPNDPRRA